jgi:subfamily B ATP-binding cassette protein MsbA
MACVGAAQALTALLIGPIFDRVLNPSSAEAPVRLISIPGLNRELYLEHLAPAWVSNVWTMVAIAILVVFLVKGVADYIGNYLISYAGFSAVTDLRQAAFDKVLRQETAFF